MVTEVVADFCFDLSPQSNNFDPLRYCQLLLNRRGTSIYNLPTLLHFQPVTASLVGRRV
jgi:hypothetical protein